MARPSKHPRTGVYWFRRRVPADLVPIIGSGEISRSLKTKDANEAKARFVEVLAEVEAQWANLRAGPRELTQREAHSIAATVFEFWLNVHRDYPSFQAFWQTDRYPDLWTHTPLPEEEATKGVPGEVPMENILLPAMKKFCLKQAEFGLEHHGIPATKDNLFTLAKACGAALQRASLVLERQAQGYSPELQGCAQQNTGHEGRVDVKKPGPANAKVSLSNLIQGWWAEAQAVGLKPSTYESYRNTLSSFVAFLGHDDAGRVTKSDVLRFKDHRLSTPSPRTGRPPSAKTVKDSDLAALKAVFGWAVINLKMASNPASGVTLRVAKPPKMRSKAFSDSEATAILKAALAHSAGKENPKTATAKRWVPWLCAFTGARVGEIAQLRKEDVTLQSGHWVIRITPEAGTVKTNEARNVVLHQQLIELGFPAFVGQSQNGPLFLTPGENGNVLGPLQGLKNRLAEFARAIVSDPNVAPNHGWRHRFKTTGMEAGIAPRILDAIQGQAPRSVADTYGDVTLKTMATAIGKLPTYDVS